ncbi:aldo/keto reductase [candidate division KSB1 bacterium]|nr:aldo/keto reductase [candidate division KSB1 bacterium]
MIAPKLYTPDGLPMSRIAWGFRNLHNWHLTTEQLVSMLQECIEIGVTTMDHADIYGEYTCERLFGDALSTVPSLRDKLQLVTKCGIVRISKNSTTGSVHHYDTSKKHIIASVEASLLNFRTDRIDLLLIHRPDPLMNTEDIASAFSDLKSAGKVLHFGVSNFTTWQYNLIAGMLDFPLVTNQIEFSVLQIDALTNGTLDQCQQRKLPVMAWGPFSRGRLFTDSGTQLVRLRNTLEDIREWIGAISIAQVALAWIMNHPAKIVPVLGTSKIDHMWDAAKATSIRLSREQWFKIWGASTGRTID